MTINQKSIKISSRLPVAQEIQLGDDVVILIKGQEYIVNCVKSEDRDLQDGTIDRIYTLKYIGE